MSSGTQRGAKVAAFGIAARAVTQVVTVVITIVAARYLDPANFGIFSLAAILTVLGRTLLYVGAYEYLMKSEDPDLYSLAGLLLNIMAAIVFSALLIGAGFIAAPYLGGAVFFGLLVILAPSNLLSAISAWQEALVLRSGKLTGYYIITIIAEVSAGILTVVLLEMGLGLTALAIQLYLRAILLCGGFALVDRPAFGSPPSRQSLRTIAAWSRPRYGAVFTNYLSNYAADFIIGILLSPSATGLYRTGSRIATAVSDLFTQPANLVCRTAFSRLIRSGKVPDEVWPDALLVFGILALPALAGLAVLSNEIISLMLGPAWQGAAQVIATLCLARAFGLIPAIVSPLLIVQDRQRTVLAIQALAAVLTIAGLLWFARLGLLPAATTVALVQGALAAAMLVRLAKINGLDTKRLLKIAGVLAFTTVIVAAAAKVALSATTSGGVAALSAAVLAGTLAWSCVAFAVRRPLAQSLRKLQ